jgi:hypothetical protein
VLYCTECADRYGLEQRAFQIFYQDCEICYKKCTTVHFDPGVVEWKNTKQEQDN